METKQTNTLRCSGVPLEGVVIGDLPEAGAPTLDVACVPDRAVRIDARDALEAAVERARRMSGADLQAMADAVAQAVLRRTGARDVEVTLAAPLDPEATHGARVCWTCALHAAGQEDGEARPGDAALPVRAESRVAVVSMESRMPNAEQVFRTVIVALDGIPGNQVEGISPLYFVAGADGVDSRSAVLALRTTMSAPQLSRALGSLHAAHEGAVDLHVVQMDGFDEEGRPAPDVARRAAVLAPWMDMDPDATLRGEPLAFLLASAPDAPFVGMQSDHWIIGGGR